MKILSEGKFRDFDGFHSMGIKKTRLLTFDRTKIECTDDHQFKRIDGVWVEAKDMIPGEMYNEYTFVTSMVKDEKEVFDAINVRDTHSFYAEGLTAHNCSFLYIDESAHLTNWEEFFASVYPTISSGQESKILLTSTPNSLNHFWKTCKEAQEEVDPVTLEGKNGYQYIEAPWHRVPGRDEKWKQETLAAIGWNLELFEQEYNCVTGDTFVTIRDIESGEIKEITIEELYSLM